MKLQNNFTNVHPIVVFWLGVLTGAIVVALVFFYKFLVPVDYSDSLIKGGSRNGNQYQQVMPNINTVPDLGNRNVKPQALPTPQGNLEALPTPQGNLPTPQGN